MSEETLIELVKLFPVLYDQKQKDYKDHTVRNALWEEISQTMNVPATTCKDTWNKLRNAYASAIKRRRTKSGQAAAHITPWKFEKEMSFLSGHMDTRQTLTNFETSTSSSSARPESQCSSTISPHSPESEIPPLDNYNFNNATSPARSYASGSNKRGLHDIYNLMQTQAELRLHKYQSKVELDECDHFFLSMSKSLKRLPMLDQTKIKLDLHKAIHDAEVRQIESSVLRTPITVTSCRRIPASSSAQSNLPASTSSYQEVHASTSHSSSLAHNSQSENLNNTNSPMSLYFSTVMPEEDEENSVPVLFYCEEKQ